MSFRQDVQSSRVRHPTQRGFNEADWAAAHSASGTGEDDDSLLVAGLWIHAFLSSLRDSLDRLGIAELPAERLRLAVGVINAHAKVTREAGYAPFSGPGPVSVMEGMDSAYDLAGLLDAARHVVSMYGQGSWGTRPVQDVPDVAWRSLRLAQLYDWLEDLWILILWRGWTVSIDGNRVAVVPTDLDLETRLIVAQIRANDLLSQFGWMARRSWDDLPLEMRRLLDGGPRVVAVERVGRRKRYVVERPAPGAEPSHELVLSLFAEELYFADTLNRPLKNIAGLTVRQLLSVWRLVSSLCTVLSRVFPAAVSVSKAGTARQFAPVVARLDLLSLLKRHLELSDEEAGAALDLLTFRGTPRDDLWQRPFIPLDGDELTFTPEAVIVPNLLRSIEAWIRLGGLNLDERGGLFEQHVKEWLAGHNSLPNCQISRTNLELRDGSVVEEVDMLILVGTHLIVCELKCSVYPATPLEEFNFIQTLREGVQQASRKAEWIQERLVRLSDQCPFPIDEVLAVTPCVLSNLPLAARAVPGPVPVCDLRLLARYLDEGEVRMGVATDDVDGGTPVRFYDSPAAAAANVRDYLRNPPQLRIIEEMVSPREIEVAWPDHEGRSISLQVAVVKAKSVEGIHEAAVGLAAT